MRILYVLHTYPPESSGGTELHARAIARSLARVHDVRVFTRSGALTTAHGEISRSVEDGIRITRFHNHFEGYGSFEWIYKDRAAHEAFERELDDFAPDIVHIQHPTMLSTTIAHATKKRGLPLVLSLHDFWTICPRGQRLTVDRRICDRIDRNKCYTCLSGMWPNWFHDRLHEKTVVDVYGNLSPETLARFDAHMQEVFELADVIVCPSRFHRQKMVEFGLDPKRTIALPHGLDHTPFVTERDPREDVRVIGFIGSVIPPKGVDVLVDAFRLLNDDALELHIHGDAPPFHEKRDYLYDLKTLALGIPQPVRFLGRYDNEQVAKILAGIDILVVPSLWWETFCLTIREAMLAGVPVVASDVGAMREAVETHQSGLCFRAGDAADLARVLSRLIGDAGLRERLSNRRREVKTIDQNAEEYLEVYERAKQAAEARRDQTKVSDPKFPEPAAKAEIQPAVKSEGGAPAPLATARAAGDVRLSIEKTGLGDVRVQTRVERGESTRVSFVIGYGPDDAAGEIHFTVDFATGQTTAAAARVVEAPKPALPEKLVTPAPQAAAKVAEPAAAVRSAAESMAETQTKSFDDKEREKAMYMLEQQKIVEHVKRLDDMSKTAHLPEAEQTIAAKPVVAPTPAPTAPQAAPVPVPVAERKPAAAAERPLPSREARRPERPADDGPRYEREPRRRDDERPQRNEERAPRADDRPLRDDRPQRSDDRPPRTDERPPRSDDRLPRYEDRPPRRDERPRTDERPRDERPRRDERPTEARPQREDRPFEERPRREDRPIEDRPRRDDRPIEDRPRREDRNYDDRPRRRDELPRYEDRPPRADDRPRRDENRGGEAPRASERPAAPAQRPPAKPAAPPKLGVGEVVRPGAEVPGTPDIDVTWSTQPRGYAYPTEPVQPEPQAQKPKVPNFRVGPQPNVKPVGGGGFLEGLDS